MSPQVDNFVHSLVEMARAQEMLPQVEADRDSLSRKLNETLDVVQSRELAIIDYKNEIAVLQDRIRSLEVERDDASFRVMEAEDREHNVLAMAKAASVSLEQITRLLDPPKPEPVKEPEAPKQEWTDTTDQYKPLPNAVHSIEETSPGQSEGGPTVGAGEAQMDAVSPPATSMDVGSTTTETSSAEPISGPYSGKLYHDYPTYVPLHDWLDGGGTEESYHWRPSPTTAANSH